MLITYSFVRALVITLVDISVMDPDLEGGGGGSEGAFGA